MLLHALAGNDILLKFIQILLRETIILYKFSCLQNLSKVIVSTTNKPDIKYFGISETPFKDCCRNQTRDFRHKESVRSTELTKYIWKLKDEGETPSTTRCLLSTVLPKEVFVDYV